MPGTVPAPSSTGFTLIELLVVVAILAVLAGLMQGAVSLVWTKAKDLSCLSQLRQLGLGMQAYADENEGVFTPLNLAANDGGGRWYTNLLDEGGQIPVAAGDWQLKAWGNVRRGLWRCPGLPDARFEWGSYGILYDSAHGSFLNGKGVLRSQVRSTSSRILVCDTMRFETNASAAYTFCPANIPWGAGIARQADPRHASGKRVNAAFFDGHAAGLPFSDLASGFSEAWEH